MKKRSPTEIGRAGEDGVSRYLKSLDYKIIDQNWRTPFCEIDIIAKKDKTVFLVEVKYRSSAFGGDGFDAITPNKLAQMKRAADAWVHLHHYTGLYQLAVASVDAYDHVKMILLDD